MDKKQQNPKALSVDLQENIRNIKSVLPSEDILVYEFLTGDDVRCAAVYADGITDKELLGSLVARPLSLAKAPKTIAEAKKLLYFPESKEAEDVQAACGEILAGNPVLFADGMEGGLVLGTKKVTLRAITVKGPREGFIEDVKTNMSLIRRRLKTPALRFKSMEVGRHSKTLVCVAYLDGIADEKVVKEIEQRISAVDIDGVPDSSYIAKFISKKPYSVFKQIGTTEKPDILCAKMLEGRVAILADGSPIALTVPYMLAEDFQSSQDYFVSPFRATVSRILRMIAVFAALYLPAAYVAAELFKLQLIPLNLLLIISGGTQTLALSPSLEMFFLLAVLEILIEASIRMPKYVALALSVIGALVLGDTAVKAGIVSSPAIIIVALSGISAYTVPDLTGTFSLLRLALVVVAGSIGTYGIILLTALILYYLVSSDSYGTPLLAPFSPLIKKDLRDTLYKTDIYALDTRPAVFRGKNRTRLKVNNRKEASDGQN